MVPTISEFITEYSDQALNFIHNQFPLKETMNTVIKVFDSSSKMSTGFMLGANTLSAYFLYKALCSNTVSKRLMKYSISTFVFSLFQSEYHANAINFGLIPESTKNVGSEISNKIATWALVASITLFCARPIFNRYVPQKWNPFNGFRSETPVNDPFAWVDGKTKEELEKHREDKLPFIKWAVFNQKYELFEKLVEKGLTIEFDDKLLKEQFNYYPTKVVQNGKKYDEKAVQYLNDIFKNFEFIKTFKTASAYFANIEDINSKMAEIQNSVLKKTN